MHCEARSPRHAPAEAAGAARMRLRSPPGQQALDSALGPASARKGPSCRWSRTISTTTGGSEDCEVCSLSFNIDSDGDDRMRGEDETAMPWFHGHWRSRSRGPEPTQPPLPPRLASSEDPMKVTTLELEECLWNTNELKMAANGTAAHGKAYPRGPSFKLIECCFAR